jgi:hypothetical protein
MRLAQRKRREREEREKREREERERETFITELGEEIDVDAWC